MASSARRGVMSVPACIKRSRRVAPPRSNSRLLLLCLVDLQLFIEAANDRLQFINGGVVLLNENLLLFIRFFLLVRRQLLRILRGREIHFELQTIEIRVHLAVVTIEIMLRGD